MWQPLRFVCPLVSGNAGDRSVDETEVDITDTGLKSGVDPFKPIDPEPEADPVVLSCGEIDLTVFCQQNYSPVPLLGTTNPRS